MNIIDFTELKANIIAWSHKLDFVQKADEKANMAYISRYAFLRFH
ncbi:MAG: hypothetical protein ACD_29C00058G0001 [uncultured bacterium]|nr:MAG: hypothetical protein ACD_29C00058G0001 [uncultured bacterium]